MRHMRCLFCCHSINYFVSDILHRCRTWSEGVNDGCRVGCREGRPSGCLDGWAVGRRDGWLEGVNSGCIDGLFDGFRVG